MEARLVKSLLDSDVLIEVLRGSPAAKSWLTSVAGDVVEMPIIVSMELVAGCRNSIELTQCRRLMSAFAIAWPDQSEQGLALDLLVGHRLRDGIGIPDCLIAAIALHRGMKLYSFNLRHFRALPGLNCVVLYDRNQTGS